MRKVFKNITEVVGNTPIVQLNAVTKDLNAEIFAKCEFLNPGGSIKERIGRYIIEQAEKSGDLKPGGTIIEATSGNTGIGLAQYAALRGYKCVIVMTDKQSQEKINILKAYGAEVIKCPYEVLPDDPKSYYSVAKKLSEEIENSHYVDQYNNENNPKAHYCTTGPEIYEQMEGNFDTLAIGIGTGGTITGTALYLKEKMPNLKVVAIDIKGSILPHYHSTKEIIDPKPYVLEGLGEDIIPPIINFDIIDEFIIVEDEESMHMTRRLPAEEGILAGMSSGAAVLGSIKYAKTHPEAKKIVTLLPDTGSRYLGRVFNDEWMKEKGYLA